MSYLKRQFKRLTDRNTEEFHLKIETADGEGKTHWLGITRIELEDILDLLLIRERASTPEPLADWEIELRGW